MPVLARQDASASSRLRDKIELLLPVQLAAGRRLFDHPRLTELYPEYLVTMHGIIRASVTYVDGGRSVRLTMIKEPVEKSKVHVTLREGTMTLDMVRPPVTVRVNSEMNVSFAAEDTQSVILPVVK